MNTAETVMSNLSEQSLRSAPPRRGKGRVKRSQTISDGHHHLQTPRPLPMLKFAGLLSDDQVFSDDQVQRMRESHFGHIDVAASSRRNRSLNGMNLAVPRDEEVDDGVSDIISVLSNIEYTMMLDDTDEDVVDDDVCTLCHFQSCIFDSKCW